MKQVRTLEQILAGTADHIFVVDPEGHVDFVNDAGARALGLTSSEIVGRTLRDVGFPTDDQTRFEREWAALMSNRQPPTRPMRSSTPAGRCDRDWVLTPLRAADGSVDAVVVTVYSATERQQPEQKSSTWASHAETEAEPVRPVPAVPDRPRLWSRERRARREAERLALERAAVLGQIADGVVIVDPEGVVTFVNEAARRLLGQTGLGTSVSNYAETYHLLTVDRQSYPPDDVPLARTVRHGETIVDAQLRIGRPDATEIVVQGSTTPVGTDDGTRLGAVWTFRDVTDQQEFEARKLEFISTVSHELRTPLTVIKGQAQYLASHLDRAGPAASETLLPRLEKIDQTATTMTTMINQLLDVARGNLGPVTEPASCPTAMSSRKAQELAAVGLVAGALVQELTLDRVAAVVAEQGQRLFNGAAVSVWLADLPREELHLLAMRSDRKVSDETMDELRSLPFSSTSIPSLAARTGQPVEIRDTLATGPSLAMSRRRVMRDGLRSAFSQPLFAKGRLVGVITILYATPHVFLEQERALIRALGDLWAVAIDNARLYHDAEQAARSANESLVLLDTLQEKAPIGFAFVDRNLRFGRINQAMAAINGVPIEKTLGRTIPEVIPTIAAKEDECVLQVLETGRPVLNREVRGETPAAPGTTRDWLVNYYPVRLPDGNLLGVGIMVTEITERKRLEEKLTEQLAREKAALAVEETERTRLRAVLEQLPEGVALFDANGHLVFLNRAARALSVAAKEPGDPHGNPLVLDTRLPSGEPFPFDELPATRAIRDGETVRGVEALLRQEDGRMVPIQVGAAPVYCLRGERFGTVMAFQDISALKALEREREEWISIVTHDLRQPVTTILGYAGLLAKMLAQHATREERKAIEYILTSTQNLNKMISDLLDVSRIETRRLKIEPLLVDLTELVRKVIERTDTLIQGHTLRVEVRGAIPPVRVDPARIEQVLGNLLSNAVKYGYANTDIQVTMERGGDEVVVGVLNQGDGIPADELPKLFSRFHRTRQPATERIAGLGLGLYITKGLVEAHGGRIWVESIPSQTTIFRFSLPIGKAT